MLDSQDSRFFAAFHALAVNHGGRRAGLPPGLLAAFEVERVMNVIQRPIVIPALQIAVQVLLAGRSLGMYRH